MKTISLLLILCFFVACSNVQNSAGKALENAGSAIEHSTENVWLPVEGE